MNLCKLNILFELTFLERVNAKGYFGKKVEKLHNFGNTCSY